MAAKPFQRFLWMFTGVGLGVYIYAPAFYELHVCKWLILAAMFPAALLILFGDHDWYDKGPRWERKKKESHE